MNIDLTILMNLMKLGLGRLGVWVFVGKVPAFNSHLGAGSLVNLGVYNKLFDNKLRYLTN
ncbi:MAG: hypothetical protein UT32_C0018G0033 [Parcubacteria group bacterium GW2011_GWC2_39_14]|nr:MAG: hypothetical protein UT32_C0018G0033 [Parcubacteria group bacterium GW2011_GWC2_39_14]KKR54740.1 MAG: hypothetical protein UT91_C0010G0033 [Parcubacteria group bacterium GW2011_GWA2_40_23]